MIKYPIQLHYIEQDGEEPCYFVFLPDFGASSCSATGDTPDEALDLLDAVLRDVMEFYKEEGRTLPRPSAPPLGWFEPSTSGERVSGSEVGQQFRVPKGPRDVLSVVNVATTEPASQPAEAQVSASSAETTTYVRLAHVDDDGNCITCGGELEEFWFMRFSPSRTTRCLKCNPVPVPPLVQAMQTPCDRCARTPHLIMETTEGKNNWVMSCPTCDADALGSDLETAAKRWIEAH